MTPVERLVRAIFRRLDAAGLDWVVLRNYQGLPRDIGNDLDLMVPPRQRRVAEAAVLAATRTGLFGSRSTSIGARQSCSTVTGPARLGADVRGYSRDGATCTGRRNLKAFITGGSGFIGTNLVADLLGDGVEVLNYDRSPPLDSGHRRYWLQGDILESEALAEAVAGYGPTHLVHLAARVDTDGRTLADYRDNTEGTASVLKVIAEAPTIARSVITSSQFVCQPGYIPRHDEDYAPHTIYGESKVVSEQLTRRAGLPSAWTIIRPTTIWGPWLLRHRRQFFRVMKSGLYVHPGSSPVVRSWGYVGNVTYQIRKILKAPADLVDRKTFYLGDPPRDLLDWVNGFSRQIAGRDARIVPRRLVWGLGVIGDLAGRIGLPFPITTSRYASMTQDYLTPMEPIFDLVGPSPYTLEDAIDATLMWLEAMEVNDHGVRAAARVDGGAVAGGAG